MTLVHLAAAFAIFSIVLHLVSIAAAAVRCKPARKPLPPSPDAPPVSVVIPVCGLENYVAQTLGSAFRLDYPAYELIFCVARADDPAVALLRRLMADYGGVDAKLLIGDERICANPKLNNLLKGWAAARHAWIAIPDSNVLMPPDYLQRLQAAWKADTGLVSSPPTGIAPDGAWAALECAFLNGYQARWQYFADAVGLGFAQGKTMLWRRADLERAGGLQALAAEAAEDAAATKIVRAAHKRVRLVTPPARQPLGRRTLPAVWNRQRRWARLRRASFPLYFIPELIAGGLLPLAAAGFAAASWQWPLLPVLIAAGTLWYGAEYLLNRVAGWPRTAWWLPGVLARDLMLPLLWFTAWGNGFEWRGTPMQAADPARPLYAMAVSGEE